MKFIWLLLIAINLQASVYFDGVNDQLVKSDQFVQFGFNWVEKFSVAIWVRRDVTNSCNLCSDSDDQIQSNDGAHLCWELSCDNANTNRIDFSYRLDSDLSLQRFSSAPNAASVTNQWMHIAFVINRNTPSAILYINGIAQTGGSWTSGVGTGLPYSGAGCELGGFHNSQLLQGHIADFACWRQEELTAVQIRNLALSHVKRMPTQIRISQLIYSSMDQFFDGQAGTGTNGFTNLSINSPGNNKRAIGFTGFGSPSCRAERVSSYPPNE